jgi:hypothetical protein
VTTEMQDCLTDYVTERFEALYDLKPTLSAPGPFALMTANQREWELWKAEGGQV